MSGFMFYVAALACIATFCILAFGIGGFGSGKMTPQTQNKLMRFRIAAQFIAVCLILLTVWLAKGGF